MSITDATSRTRVLRRFQAATDKQADGCWIWQAKRGRDGYGRFSIQCRWHMAHRISHQLFKGPIPPGLDVDHLCRVRACVNPDHLEAVTRQVNLRRNPYIGAKVAQTHCKRDHEFTDANTYINAKGNRECRACGALFAREKKARLRELMRVDA
jgi:hypothetical protein